MSYSCIGCTCGKQAFPMRYVLVILLILCLMIGHSQRVCLHITIVDMVIPFVEVKNISEGCPITQLNITKKVAKDCTPRKNWSQMEQSIVLQGYFLGYCVGHIPLGFLCDKYSVQSMAIGFSVSTICTGLIPATAYYFNHYAYIVVLRILTGLGQSVFFPSITVFMTNWIPEKEQSTIGAAIFSAVALGVILGTLCSGLIIEYGKCWDHVFYCWGFVGVCWVPLFLLYVRASPSRHKRITQSEREYLEDIIKKTSHNKPPFKKIFSDHVILAVILCQFGFVYIFLTLQVNLPKFIKDVLHFEIKENKFISSLPYIGNYVASILGGMLVDRLIAKNYNIGFLRKCFTIISMVIPSACLVLAGYSECNKTAILTYFVIAIIVGGLFNSGLKMNVMDLTKCHASFVMSLVHGVGNSAGILSTSMIGFIAADNAPDQWIQIFWITFALPSFLLLFFIIFGTGKRRKWDYDDENEYLIMDTNRKKAKIKWYRETADQPPTHSTSEPLIPVS